MPVQYWDGDSYELRDKPFSAGPREQFLAQILAILGDVRLLFLPNVGDTTTALDRSLNARTITFDGDVSARLARLGLGYAQSFNGSSQYATIPDAADLSFGNGSADQAFSVVALGNVVDTAATRRIVCKLQSDSTDQEWTFGIASTDVLQLQLIDQSAGVGALRGSSAAVVQGSYALWGASYSGAGGATAANGITLYENGLVKASGAGNNASYVAMEDLTARVVIGGIDGPAQAAPSSPQFFNGSLPLVAVTAKNLAAWEHWALYQACLSYFDFLA